MITNKTCRRGFRAKRSPITHTSSNWTCSSRRFLLNSISFWFRLLLSSSHLPRGRARATEYNKVSRRRHSTSSSRVEEASSSTLPNWNFRIFLRSSAQHFSWYISVSLALTHLRTHGQTGMLNRILSLEIYEMCMTRGWWVCEKFIISREASMYLDAVRHWNLRRFVLGELLRTREVFRQNFSPYARKASTFQRLFPSAVLPGDQPK